MFSNLNWWEIAVLALIALFIFGPERLPKVISDGVRMIRTLRDMARNATADLSRELGTDVKLEDLHPKTFIRKHLLSEEDEAALRRPFDDAYQEVKRMADDVNDTATGLGAVDAGSAPQVEPGPVAGQPAGGFMGQPTYPSQPGYPGQTGYGQPGYSEARNSPRHAAQPGSFDDDAT